MRGFFGNEIDEIFKILIYIFLLSICLYFFTRFDFFVFLAFGIFVSIIANGLLAYAVYKVVYMKAGRVAMFMDFTKRVLLYILALYFVYKISPKSLNLIITTLGFLSFQIVLYIKQIFLK